MIVYENVFSNANKIFVRELNTETNEVLFSIKEIDIPFFYPNKSGNYKAYQRHGVETNLKRNDLNYKTFIQEKKHFKDTDRMLYGRENLALEWIFQNYPNSKDCIHDFHTWFIDIEVSGSIDKNAKKSNAWKPEFAQQEITLIQVYDSLLECYLVWSLKEYSGNLDYNIINFTHNTEADLLKSFIHEMRKRKPAILVGWNTIFYDFPYLTNRISRVLDKNEDLQDEDLVTKGSFVSMLSPFGIVEKYKGENEEYLWKGIILEDYMNIYKKYTFHTLDSYSLNSVCSYELGKEKISHDEFSNFVEFYNTDFNLFYEYGIKDVELLVELDKKLKLLDLCAFISYMCGVCIPDIRGTLKQWNNYVYNEAFKRGIVLPYRSPYKKENVKFIGGIVHSTTNKWEWVASFDFTSLYPSLISWMNLGGDTLYIPNKDEKDLLELQNRMLEFQTDTPTEEVKENIISWVKSMFFSDSEEYKQIHEVLEKYNLCMAANGTFFTRDKKSLFAELIENLLIERQKLKKEMKKVEAEIETLKAQGKDYKNKKKLQDYFETNQVALKVLANSAYGILSMEACSFAGNNKYFSNAITTTGQCFDVLVGLELGNLIQKINDSLPEKERVKDKQKGGLKWVVQMDTDSVVCCFHPLIKYIEYKHKK